MGRNVETDFLNHIEQSLKEEGIKEIIGEYIEMPKNKVVGDFWLLHKYQNIEKGTNGLTRFFKEFLTSDHMNTKNCGELPDD